MYRHLHLIQTNELIITRKSIQDISKLVILNHQLSLIKSIACICAPQVMLQSTTAILLRLTEETYKPSTTKRALMSCLILGLMTVRQSEAALYFRFSNGEIKNVLANVNTDVF